MFKPWCEKGTRLNLKSEVVSGLQSCFTSIDFTTAVSFDRSSWFTSHFCLVCAEPMTLLKRKVASATQWLAKSKWDHLLRVCFMP